MIPVFLLALDTCDSKGSVALLREGEVLQTVVHDTSEDYSSWLLPAVNEILRPARISMADVGAFAAAAGPGSFTGVRVGLTTVKAWSEVYARPIAAVSRLEALAAQASGNEPYVAAFADARRGQVFGALYHRRDSEHRERIGNEMVIAPERFAAWVVEIAGSARVRWISATSHCLLETEAWPSRRSLGETVEAASDILAPVVGRLGYQLWLAKRLTDPLALDANYVRRSDAEIFWKDGPRNLG
jgi:tRNA threonylcarbamoyladenosine biosynthesis protein TsaB